MSERGSKQEDNNIEVMMTTEQDGQQYKSTYEMLLSFQDQTTDFNEGHIVAEMPVKPTWGW